MQKGTLAIELDICLVHTCLALYGCLACACTKCVGCVGERVHCNLLGSVQHIHYLCLRSACATAEWCMMLWHSKATLGCTSCAGSACWEGSLTAAWLCWLQCWSHLLKPLRCPWPSRLHHRYFEQRLSATASCRTRAACDTCLQTWQLDGGSLLAPLHRSRLLTNPLHDNYVSCCRGRCACCATAGGATPLVALAASAVVAALWACAAANAAADNARASTVAVPNGCHAGCSMPWCAARRVEGWLVKRV
jgi:hypothetical protein